MRQKSKRARRSRLLMILIFVLLAALLLWGLAAIANRLFHYGANATVSAKDSEPLSPIEPSTTDQTDTTQENTYDPACFYTEDGFLRLKY